MRALAALILFAACLAAGLVYPSLQAGMLTAAAFALFAALAVLIETRGDGGPLDTGLSLLPPEQRDEHE